MEGLMNDLKTIDGKKTTLIDEISTLESRLSQIIPDAGTDNEENAEVFYCIISYFIQFLYNILLLLLLLLFRK